MKKWIGLTLFALLISGCIPSVHPIYTSKDLVSSAYLEGTWKQKDEPQNIYTFTEKENKEYRLKYDEGGKLATFKVHLLKLGEQLYFDFVPKQSGSLVSEINSLFESTMVPMHTFAKIALDENSLDIYLLNPEWIEEMIDNDPLCIKHEKMEDRILLTASTEELQRFIKKYENNEKTFLEVVHLEKQ